MKTVSLYKFNEKELDNIVKNGFKEIGLDKKLKQIKTVFIKPNLVTDNPEYIKNGANTDIRLIESVLKYLSRYKLKIYLGESDSGTKIKGRKLEYSLEIMGVNKLKKKYKFDIVNLTNDEQIEVKIKDAKFLKKIKLPKTILDSDIIIDMPKIKTHKYSKITCALKNMFGTIPDPVRIIYHENIHQTLADLNRLYLDKTYVLTDGINCMEGNGPIYGKPVKLNVIMFSDSMFCNDIIACKLICLDNNLVKHIKLVSSYLSEDDKKFNFIEHIKLNKVKRKFILANKNLFVKIEGKLMQHKFIVKILFSRWFQTNITYHLRHILKKLRGGNYTWYIDKNNSNKNQDKINDKK